LTVLNTGQTTISVDFTAHSAELQNCTPALPVNLSPNQQVTITCDLVGVFCPNGLNVSATVQGTAVATAEQPCIWDPQGNPITTAPATCGGTITCLPAVTCRVTGGGVLTPGLTDQSCNTVNTAINPTTTLV